MATIACVAASFVEKLKDAEFGARNPPLFNRILNFKGNENLKNKVNKLVVYLPHESIAFVLEHPDLLNCAKRRECLLQDLLVQRSG